ncbi:MAG: HNH endonuclease, partial [Bacteroidia bacterium]|nr:HNH endonuclease [Bacteroidia bacterium]
CEMCKQRLPLGKLQVDHITPAGAMDGLDGMGAWASRLFCHKDNMQFLCKPCHRVKSIQDVYQISVSEARREVFYNETVKMSVAAQKRVLELLRLSQHDTNKSSREKAFKTLLKIHWK